MKNKLFKWIGGKKWLSKELGVVFLKYKNKNIECYAEPFVGGLGSFLYTFDKINELGIKKVYLNDLNNVLIQLYKDIKYRPDKLFEKYAELENSYSSLSCISLFDKNKKKDKEYVRESLSQAKNYFNKVREEYNLKKHKGVGLDVSVCFLFLMQHCFNGVYRENSSGMFNVSYNWEPAIANLENKKESIYYYSNLFNEMDVVFSSMDCFDFLESIKKINKKTLIYMDPPYLNIKGGENNYNKLFFGLNEQNRLLKYCDYFNNVVFSNHDNKIFKVFFKKNNFKLKIVKRSNVINSNKAKRSLKCNEILAYKKV